MAAVDAIRRKVVTAAGTCCVVVAVTQSGCSYPVVRSVGADHSLAGSGIAYYLPKRMLKVTFSRQAAPSERQVTEAKAKLDTAEEALATAKADVEKAERLVRDAPRDNPDALAELRKQLGVAQARLQGVMESQRRANVDYQGLQGAFDKKTMTETFSLTVLDPVADPSHRYWAQPIHAASRNDQFNLKTNRAGLLTGTAATAEDKTAEIVSQVAGFVSAVTGAPGGALLPHVFGARPPLAPGAPAPRVGCPIGTDPISVDFFIDPITLSTAQGQFDATATLDQDLCDLGAPFVVRRSELPPTLAPGQPGAQPRCRSAAPDPTPVTCEGGLFYRRELPYVFTVYHVDASGSRVAGQFIGALPNDSPVEFIALDGGSLVKTSYTTTFENGMLVEYASDRPSEALALARLPVQVLSAIFSVPADLLTLRINLIRTEKNVADEQKSLLDSLKTLQQAREAQAPATTTP